MFVTVDALAREYDTLIHFTPTIDQRKRFAKQGVAMPGGSFYIRNVSDLDNAIAAVGRATPNANESETARRNSVRRHIMERARFLKAESRIPDTWNSDGTLKHMQGLHTNVVIFDEFANFLDNLVTDEFLEHFGVKGMRWGVRRASSTGARGPSNHKGSSGSKASPEAPKLSKHAVKKATKKAAQIENADKQITDMKENLRVLNHNKGIMRGHLEAHGKAGRTTADPKVREALALFNELSVNTTRQEKEIAKMEKFRTSLSHSDEVDEFLEHFGVKGMRWGVRRSGSVSPSHTAPRKGHFPAAHVPASRRVGRPKQQHPVADDAARTLQLKSQLSKHGPQSLTNSDLQHLVKRMQLENQLRQLDPIHKSKGRKVVDEAVKIGGNAAKQTAAQFAAKYAAEGAAHLIKLAIKMK